MNKNESTDNRTAKLTRLLRLMLTARILFSAAKVSLVVGTLLNAINQWEYVVAGQGVMIGHLLMNYLVPFCVSAYSGAKALLPQNEIGVASIRANESAEGKVDTITG